METVTGSVKPFRSRLARGAWRLAVVLGVLSRGAPGSTAAQPPPALFVRACAPCHGKDGKATTPAARKLGVRDLTLSTLSEAELQQAIREGRRASSGALQMPAFEETLKPEEIEQLARFVKTLQTGKKGRSRN